MKENAGEHMHIYKYKTENKHFFVLDRGPSMCICATLSSPSTACIPLRGWDLNHLNLQVLSILLAIVLLDPLERWDDLDVPLLFTQMLRVGPVGTATYIENLRRSPVMSRWC